MGNGVGVFAPLGEGVAEIVLRILVSRINLDGDAIISNRLIEPAVIGQVKTKIVVSEIILFSDSDGVAKKRFAAVPVADLPGGQLRTTAENDHCNKCLTWDS